MSEGPQGFIKSQLTAQSSQLGLQGLAAPGRCIVRLLHHKTLWAYELNEYRDMPLLQNLQDAFEKYLNTSSATGKEIYNGNLEIIKKIDSVKATI